VRAGGGASHTRCDEGDAEVEMLFPVDSLEGKCPRELVGMSGKFDVLARMLQLTRQKGDDRIVVVSNYTQTLDLLEAFCRACSWPVIRLDGGTSPARRQVLVDNFNDREEDNFVFLLSSRAGGCGINLIGANRLVLFDGSWVSEGAVEGSGGALRGAFLVIAPSD
jgi:SNF2 family DNA or RNA helicase